MTRRAYFDCASATPLDPAVIAAMQAAVARPLGNPSMVWHAYGREAADLLDRARRSVARLLGAKPDEIYFTSGGTEANVWALRGLLQARKRQGREIVISAVEHISILNAARRLEQEGWKVVPLPVDANGRLVLEDAARLISDETALVAVMHANHEVGTLEPVEAIVRLAHARGIPVHTDAVASAGTIPVEVHALGADTLSVAANQFFGPSGVGALYVREGLRLYPLLEGGGQEQGRRAGSENIIGIVGLGAAAELARTAMPARRIRTEAVRHRLVEMLTARLDDCHWNGHPTERLPGRLNLTLPGVDGESLLCGLAAEGIAIALSSACTMQAMKGSHVLRAMGLDEPSAQSSILLSFGHATTDEEANLLCEALPRCVERLRQCSRQAL